MFSSSSVFSLLGGRDGSLWIGTGTNLARLKDGHLVNYTNALGRINAIVEDRDGTVWITRSRIRDGNGPLCQVVDAQLRCYGKADGITFSYAGPLIDDAEGNLWIGSSSELARWRKGSSSTYTPPELKSVEGLNGIQALAATADGSVWIGLNRTGPGAGLQQMQHGVWKPVITPVFDGSTLPVNALLRDRQEAIWIGTENHGIYRSEIGQIEQYLRADGLSGDSVRGFYEDREGNLWVATADGIDCFRSTRMISYSAREGLTANQVNSVLASRDGTVWIGNNGGLDSLGTHVSSIQARNGLPGNRVTSLLEDHAGRLWVGVDNGLSVYERGTFRPITRRDGTPLGAIIAMTEDRDSSIWAEAIGNPRRLIRIEDFRVREDMAAPLMPAATSLAADPRDGIWLGLDSGDLARYRQGRLETFRLTTDRPFPVRQVLAASDGSVLAATLSGLIGWRNGVVRTLTVGNGLPCDSVFGLIADAQALWLYTQCGLVQIANADLQTWWAGGSDTVVKARVFDLLDGARPSTASFEPRVSRSPDGRLWFANGTVVQMIDPAHSAENSIPPPVHIEQVVADRKSYSPRQGLDIPARTRDLEIDYAALSFVAPQKVHFRYKLEGRDTSWQEPGSRRQAFYTDLRPGTYRFRVIASNNDGLWNEKGAALDFAVEPAWYQTKTFLVLFLMTGTLAVWAAFRLRMRGVARALNARFDDRLAERTRMARDLHDTLLQTVQGSRMVADNALSKPDDPAGMRRAMEQVSTWLGQASTEGRAAVNALRMSTTERNDLAEAFRRAIEDCGRQGGSKRRCL